MRYYYDTPLKDRLNSMIDFFNKWENGETDETTYSITLNGIELSDYLCEDAGELMYNYAERILESVLDEYDSAAEILRDMGITKKSLVDQILEHAMYRENNRIVFNRSVFKCEDIYNVFIVVGGGSYVCSESKVDFMLSSLEPSIRKEIEMAIAGQIPLKPLTPEDKIARFIKEYGPSRVEQILSASKF